MKGTHSHVSLQQRRSSSSRRAKNDGWALSVVLLAGRETRGRLGFWGEIGKTGAKYKQPVILHIFNTLICFILDYANRFNEGVVKYKFVNRVLYSS